MAPSVALGDVAIPRCVTLSSGAAPSLFHPLRLLLLSLSKSLLPLFLPSVSRLQLFVPGPLAHLLLFPDPCPFVSTFLFLFLFLCLFLSLSLSLFIYLFFSFSPSLLFFVRPFGTLITNKAFAHTRQPMQPIVWRVQSGGRHPRRGFLNVNR